MWPSHFKETLQNKGVDISQPPSSFWCIFWDLKIIPLPPPIPGRHHPQASGGMLRGKIQWGGAVLWGGQGSGVGIGRERVGGGEWGESSWPQLDCAREGGLQGEINHPCTFGHDVCHPGFDFGCTNIWTYTTNHRACNVTSSRTNPLPRTKYIQGGDRHNSAKCCPRKTGLGSTVSTAAELAGALLRRVRPCQCTHTVIHPKLRSMITFAPCGICKIYVHICNIATWLGGLLPATLLLTCTGYIGHKKYFPLPNKDDGQNLWCCEAV